MALADWLRVGFLCTCVRLFSAACAVARSDSAPNHKLPPLLASALNAIWHRAACRLRRLPLYDHTARTVPLCNHYAESRAESNSAHDPAAAHAAHAATCRRPHRHISDSVPPQNCAQLPAPSNAARNSSHDIRGRFAIISSSPPHL